MGALLAPYIMKFAEYLDSKAEEEKKRQISNTQMQYSNAAMQAVGNAQTPEELNSSLQRGIQTLDMLGDKESIKNLAEIGKLRGATLQRAEDQTAAMAGNMNYFDPGKMYQIEGKMVNGALLKNYLTGLNPMQQQAYLKGIKELKTVYGIDQTGKPFKTYQNEAGESAGTFAIDEKEAAGIPDIQKLISDRNTIRQRLDISKANLGIAQAGLGLRQAELSLQEQKYANSQENGTIVGQDAKTGKYVYASANYPEGYIPDGKGGKVSVTDGSTIVNKNQVGRAERMDYGKQMGDAAGYAKSMLLQYKDKAGLSNAEYDNLQKLNANEVYGYSSKLGTLQQKLKAEGKTQEAINLWNAIEKMKALKTQAGTSSPGVRTLIYNKKTGLYE